LRIDPFEPGGPFPAGRCAQCLTESGLRPEDFKARMTKALAIALDDAASARWFAGQLAARRLCEYRVQRILFRARCAVHLGAPMGVRFARAYVHGELARLAARCGLEPNRPANHANIPR